MKVSNAPARDGRGATISSRNPHRVDTTAGQANARPGETPGRARVNLARSLKPDGGLSHDPGQLEAAGTFAEGT